MAKPVPCFPSREDLEDYREKAHEAPVSAPRSPAAHCWDCSPWYAEVMRNRGLCTQLKVRFVLFQESDDEEGNLIAPAEGEIHGIL